MSEASVPLTTGESGGTQQGTGAVPDSRRWLVLVVIGIAQLMVVLDMTVMNLALPSAQRDLGFSNVDRQWIVTAYSLSFGSLLLFSGRVADLIGRKVVFITGLVGFAAASAVGGASVNFVMLVTARASQGVFGAMLAPAALALLTTTFSDPKERGKAFGVYGAIAGAGGAVGLLLGGALTEYLSWRWCLYINLLFAGLAVAGGSLLLKRQARQPGARLDIPGVIMVSGGVFSLVYGFSNAATHSWSTPSTWSYLVVGGLLLVAFAVWQALAAHPLLPPRVVLDRNRGGAYLAILIVGAGMFGVFLFVTYYMQVTLGYSPVKSGLAFLPMVFCIAGAANLSNIVLLPRIGPRPLVVVGFLLLAGGQFWLTHIGLRSDYIGVLLGPLMITGLGMGTLFSTSMNTGTYGIPPRDAGVASATVNTGQQLGGSIGTSLFNSIAASAVASYIAGHMVFHGHPSKAAVALVQAQGAIHGYTTVFWVGMSIFLGGAVIVGLLMRSGPLAPPAQGVPAASAAAEAAGATEMAGATEAVGATESVGAAQAAGAGAAGDGPGGPVNATE
jgi:EmrB/QacA subfamily drug resistance transporter